MENVEYWKHKTISIHEALANLDRLLNLDKGAEGPISIHEALANLDASRLQPGAPFPYFDPRGSCEPRLVWYKKS